MRRKSSIRFLPAFSDFLLEDGSMYKITIVGTGNAGCAHAAMFSLYGHQVTLFKTSTQGNGLNFQCVHRTKTIRVTTIDDQVCDVPLYNVTDDGADAFADCDICFVMVQTLYHEAVAKLVAKYAKKIKLLFVVPGYLGSLYFAEALGDRVEAIAEGESTAYDARIIGDGHVKILFKNVRNAIGVLKGVPSQVLAMMSELVETYQYCRRNVIESALHNPNLIVHTIGTVMSAARIEYSHGDFWMYKEAFTPSVWRLIDALDAEKMDILAHFGCERTPYVEACRFRNCEDMTVDALAVFKSYAETGSPKGPTTIQTRYVLEDVPMGLCLMRRIGERIGVPTPICTALISIASSLVGRDFSAAGRKVPFEVLEKYIAI